MNWTAPSVVFVSSDCGTADVPSPLLTKIRPWLLSARNHACIVFPGRLLVQFSSLAPPNILSWQVTVRRLVISSQSARASSAATGFQVQLPEGHEYCGVASPWPLWVVVHERAEHVCLEDDVDAGT
jgi:hypothetical protein